MRRRTVVHGLVLILGGVLAIGTPAAAQENHFTAADYYDFEWISDPQLSPSGDSIVYVRNFLDIMTDRSYSNLWIVDFDGSDHRPLTTGKFGDGSPRWSPDGKTLIYVSDRGGTPQIHKRWMDTGQTVAITNLMLPPMGITWSPDGKQIAFSAPVPSPPPVIAELPSAPPGATWAEPAKVIDRLTYRFDGMGYKIGMGWMHVFVIPAEGGTPRQITEGDFHHPLPMAGGGVEWAPDGNSLLLAVNKRDPAELATYDTEIYEYPLDGGEPKALTDRRGPDNTARVSPDGKTIAYLGFDDRNVSDQVTKLHLMNRDGSGSKVILDKLDRGISGIRWAEDGKGLYFMYTDKGKAYLAYTTVGGKMKKLATDIGEGRMAYAGAGAYSIGGGRFAVTHSTPSRPSDVGVGSVANPEVTVLTAVNDDILGHKALGAVEEIWWKSSADGLDIQGWIIKPPDFDPSKKYPMVLEIHGGPVGAYGPTFSVEKQLLASAGYVVLYANPRGSTSYGEDFINLIHHNYPGDDYVDLMSGVDAVIAEGYVDEDNLFVTGGSAGGIMTCWVVGKTDRFRAAATLYPVVNWYSLTLTSDIPHLTVKHFFNSYPWENPEEYDKFSPISLVGNVTTPTIVICGEEDYRTPMSESEQYYVALKMRGVDTALVRFPASSHGIANRPSLHMSKMLHSIAWFEKYRETD